MEEEKWRKVDEDEERVKESVYELEVETQKKYEVHLPRSLLTFSSFLPPSASRSCK